MVRILWPVRMNASESENASASSWNRSGYVLIVFDGFVHLEEVRLVEWQMSDDHAI